MWEKINKVQVANIACIILLVGLFLICTLAAFNVIGEKSMAFCERLIGPPLFAAAGYLFARSTKTQ